MGRFTGDEENWERERQLDRDFEREQRTIARTYRNATEQRELAHETLTNAFAGGK